jgi:hypothetical protein
MRAPPDGQGDDLDGIAIAENNAPWRQGDRVDDQIGLRQDAMTTTTMTRKRADDHNEEDPSKGGK